MNENRITPLGRRALTSRRNEIVRRHIGEQAALTTYAHDVATDVACRKIENIDYATRRRIQGTLDLGKQAAAAIRECPEIALLVNEALLDREGSVSRVVRGLAR